MASSKTNKNDDTSANTSADTPAADTAADAVKTVEAPAVDLTAINKRLDTYEKAMAEMKAENDKLRAENKTMASKDSTTTTEILVPAVYRYHINISDDWQYDIKGNVCSVIAPELRPTLPVAFDTSKMEKKAENGWARFNKDEQMKLHEKTLTDELAKRAQSPRVLDLVRDKCRYAVGEFVSNYLIKEQGWGGNQIQAIKVVFRDEIERPGIVEPLAQDSSKQEK